MGMQQTSKGRQTLLLPTWTVHLVVVLSSHLFVKESELEDGGSFPSPPALLPKIVAVRMSRGHCDTIPDGSPPKKTILFSA